MTLLVKGFSFIIRPCPSTMTFISVKPTPGGMKKVSSLFCELRSIPFRLDYLNIVLPKLGIKPEGLRALDVGCGGGYLSEELARLGFNVSGVDPAPASLAAAQSHAKQSGLTIDYRVAQAESLPFPDGSFDLVTCCDVLEHVQDLDRTLSEIARVLKPGGIFIVRYHQSDIHDLAGGDLCCPGISSDPLFPTRHPRLVHVHQTRRTRRVALRNTELLTAKSEECLRW